MTRPIAMMMVSVLLLAGCGQGGPELLGRVDAAGANGNSGGNKSAAKSPIVRELLQEIDDMEGENSKVKEELRRVLLGADDELARGLGDSGKQLVLDTNKKSKVAIAAGQAEADEESDEPQTPIIKALLEALDESEEDDDDNDELRTTLIEADKQLRQILGGQSKRLIEAANRKPLVPIIGPRPERARCRKASGKEATEDKEDNQTDQ